jgi:hypothetical protein
MDGLHMETEVARNVFTRIADAGRELATGWSEAMTMVADGEAGIGDDRIAAAFRAGYEQHGARTRELGDAHPQRLAADAGVGHESAADYLATEDRARRMFNLY